MTLRNSTIQSISRCTLYLSKTPYPNRFTYNTGVREEVKNMINGKEAGAKINKT